MSGKRIFDIFLVVVVIIPVAVVFCAVAILVKLTSKGPVLHRSRRVGRGVDNYFFMLKFRTMRVDTPQVATHLMRDPKKYLSPVGSFLRRTSLDEIPQLWNIIKGEMAFVGPRPALYNQDDLVAARVEKGINFLTPGLTGWAQINGRDELAIPEKVKLDEYYLQNRSFNLDCLILFKTFGQIFFQSGVSH